ncbi:MAG: hypothetical protein JWO53_1339 [Chlamydiia bacterium]|nr:hypothetical protein [Chlamydiia bacterium]
MISNNNSYNDYESDLQRALAASIEESTAFSSRSNSSSSSSSSSPIREKRKIDWTNVALGTYRGDPKEVEVPTQESKSTSSKKSTERSFNKKTDWTNVALSKYLKIDEVSRTPATDSSSSSSSLPPTLQKAAQLVSSAVLQFTDKDRIDLFVQRHLAPYFDGTITAKTENKSRPSLITVLKFQHPKFYERCLSEKLPLEDELLNAYVLESAKHLNRTEKRLVDPDDSSYEDRIEALSLALKYALRIDFIEKSLSNAQIRFMITEKLKVLLNN